MINVNKKFAINANKIGILKKNANMIINTDKFAEKKESEIAPNVNLQYKKIMGVITWHVPNVNM